MSTITNRHNASNVANQERAIRGILFELVQTWLNHVSPDLIRKKHITLEEERTILAPFDALNGLFFQEFTERAMKTLTHGIHSSDLLFEMLDKVINHVVNDGVSASILDSICPSIHDFCTTAFVFALGWS